MKKIIFLSISLLLASIGAKADIVPQSKAKSVAAKFMGSGNVTLVWDGLDVMTRSEGDPTFYVFNVAGGGWVMISAEDSTTPVLAYSDSGKFVADDMPANLSGWLEDLRKTVLAVRGAKLTASKYVKDKWDNPSRPVTKASSNQLILETANWHQLDPYNLKLSDYVNGVQNLCTGCMTTAVAIVLRYHQWPEHGTGTIGGYTTRDYKYPVSEFSIDSHTYNWSKMPLTDGRGNSSWTQENKDAVAQLFADCGIMMEVNFGTESSSAYAEDLIPAFVDHMQYSKNANLRNREYYKTSEWISLIKSELQNNAPILYSGSSESVGGHEFVCDGFDYDNNKVHINWGWGGSYNGFYTFDLEIPDEYTFNKKHRAIFGLVPDKNGSSNWDSDIAMNRFAISGTEYGDGITIMDNGTVAQGKSFNIKIGALHNSGSIDYSGAIKAVLIDKNGEWKEDLGVGAINISAGSITICGLGCKIKGAVSLGDRIAIWYRHPDNSWSPVLTPAKDYRYTWTYACYDVNFIAMKDSYSSGDTFTFELVPGNDSISEVVWYFDGIQTSEESVVLSKGTHGVSVILRRADSLDETINQEFTVK